MSKHTPGPWKYDSGVRVVFSVSESGFRDWDVCALGDFEAADLGRESDANGHLIAAAPELLEALREMLEVIEGETCGECGEDLPECECDGAAWWRRARAAIAKAEGRS